MTYEERMNVCVVQRIYMSIETDTEFANKLFMLILSSKKVENTLHCVLGRSVIETHLTAGWRKVYNG